MKDLLAHALDHAIRRGADMADARGVESVREDLHVKDGAVGGLERSESAGVGVRVLVRGGWGYAATDELTRDGVAACAERAVAIGAASATVLREPVRLAPEPAHRGTWSSECRIDPFAVPLERKLDHLVRCTEATRRVAGVTTAEAYLSFRRRRTRFLSSEGADLDQTITQSGGGMTATAVSDVGVERRSYPQADGLFLSRGYEQIEETPWLEHAERIGEEAVALLTADRCPAGVMDVILEGSQLALQIHESCGHPSELDRALGMEANYAGTSFLTPDKLGTLRYGAPCVTLTADATLPHGLATFAWDDEGVVGQRWPIVNAGRFEGYLSSRETAPRIGEGRSRGCSRADGWHHIPMIRMVNLSLEPGSGSLEELLADTDHAIYMETNRSWSIDQLRYNFQFATEIAWEYKKGKRIRMLRQPTYQGITTEFWNACDFVCGKEAWRPWSVMNCGKGQPGQVAEMTHGAAPARFRSIRVGVGLDA